MEDGTMTKWTINSECGAMDIEAETIEAAKAVYSADRGFDFDGFRDYPGSWYFIADEHGVRVEDETAEMPN